MSQVPGSTRLRFAVGARVECNVGEWQPGTVLLHWYTQPSFEAGMAAPYQVALDNGKTIYVPRDEDKCVRATTKPRPIDAQYQFLFSSQFQHATPVPVEIYRAAGRGELPKVVKWLRKGGSTDAAHSDTTVDGRVTTVPLLHAVACEGHLELARMLLKRGASVDLPTSLGITALMQAAYSGQLSILLLLMQNLASLDLQDLVGRTTLMHAAGQGQTACVQALLRAKADTELLDDQGDSALHWAEGEGHTAVAELIRAVIETRPAPSNVALSLACIGCARLPSDMDDEREKHPICSMCRDEKMPTTYLCGKNCPANPDAWELHGAFHKTLRKQWKMMEAGGVEQHGCQQRHRETVESLAQLAARTGDRYEELMAEGAQYESKQDSRRAAKACREAIALRPDKPEAYFNLGASLSNSGHDVEAAQWFLEAKRRHPVGSEGWAGATAWAFSQLKLEVCAEVAKPAWWNDEGLKALSARVVRAAPNNEVAIQMRATVLGGLHLDVWEYGPHPTRSAAELEEAATHYERAAALHPAPAVKASFAQRAGWCRSNARDFLHIFRIGRFA